MPDLFPQSHVPARYHYDTTQQLNYSLGDGLTPFVLPFNQSVLVLFNNTDNGEHPLHLHGRSFWVLATSDFPAAETLYKPYYLKRDVVSVPARGWAKVVFMSDNPGVWLLHCHIDWHVAAGMASTVVVAPERLATGLQDGSILPIHPSHLAACSAPHANAAPVAEPSNILLVSLDEVTLRLFEVLVLGFVISTILFMLMRKFLQPSQPFSLVAEDSTVTNEVHFQHLKVGVSNKSHQTQFQV